MTTQSQLETGLQRLDQTPPLRQRIHEQLETLITSGVFQPGSRLVEGELADRLGVSRGPVRETLQALANDGFVDLRPRQGAFVHTPTAKEVDDFFEIRGALESESVRLAAKRITPDGVARLEGVLAAARAALKSGGDFSTVNREIKVHAAIVEIADNPLLADMLHTLNKRWTWYVSPYKPTQHQQDAWAEHEQLLEAVLRGDARTAVKVMNAHNARALTNYLKVKAAHQG